MTGSVVSFNDAIPFTPIEALVAQINPVQDLHGYENPWPAGGGKNKLNPDGVTATNSGVTFTKASDGTWTTSGTAANLVAYPVGTFDIKSGESYILTGCLSGGGTSSYRLDVRATAGAVYHDWVNTGNTDTPTPYTATEDATLRVYIRIANGYNANGLTFKPMIRLSSVTDATYAPYSNICPISGWDGLNVWVENEYDPTAEPTVEVSWETEAGTVYGGTLDVLSGLLTVNRAIITYDGSSDEQWGGTSASGWYIQENSLVKLQDYSNAIICNAYKTGKTQAKDGAVSGYVDANDRYPNLNWIYLHDSNIATNADLIAFLQASPIQVVYQLAQTQTYELTPQQASTLLGENNVWVDTGDVSITYQSTSGSTPVRTSFKSPLKNYSYSALKMFGNTFIEHGKG